VEFLMREQAPLNKEQWELIDKAVVEVARRHLVGRRFLEIYGPLGVGMQTVPLENYSSGAFAEVGAVGHQEDASPVRAVGRAVLNAPLIFKDFVIHWRDLETTKRLNVPFDVTLAAAASAFCCHKEDELIFNGAPELGLHGILTVPDRNTSPLGDWNQVGAGFDSVVAAVQKLTAGGFFAPYALITSPRLYAVLHRLHGGGAMEIDHVRKLMEGGVFQTPVLGDNKAVVISLGPQNLDIAICQDLVTAYLGPEGMDHRFRVLESLVLRIKRPGAICTLE
jgi:uncharacterized linocin/CFP29 family protein